MNYAEELRKQVDAHARMLYAECPGLYHALRRLEARMRKDALDAEIRDDTKGGAS